jgi:predicted O-linked N-acetylglucosamine transferase (SPINDLY family)
VVPPLTLLGICDDPYLQRRCSEINTMRSLANVTFTAGPVPMGAGRPAKGRARIKLGYLSSDFRNHPVGLQIAGLLESHDRTRFEVIGLSIGHNDGSAARKRIESSCDQFHDLSSAGSYEAAQLIRRLEVDILVDLNGQTQGWRPAILKYRPAPVIVTYFGYAGTTGSDFVDYIIGDPHVTPFDLAPAMSEKIVQLPYCFWPADAKPVQPAPVLRAEAGLPEDAFVFCCFNASHKIRPALFDSWMRILRDVPKSVLWVRDASATVNERLRRQARRRGVADSRILFAGRIEDLSRHLGRQRLADLFLDTFPYNAHVTAIDALGAGLPLLTLQGKSFVSRVAASFLINLDLPELVTTTLSSYEEMAIALAKNPARLAAIRRRLQDAKATSILFDAASFARTIEAAFERMQHRHEGGEGPAGFSAGEAPSPS